MESFKQEEKKSNGSIEQQIKNEIKKRAEPLKIVTTLNRLGHYSKSVVIMATDGKKYNSKGILKNRNQVKRTLITEQIFGKVANAIKSPVPNVVLLEVPSEQKNDPLLNHIDGNLLHGILWIADCSKKPKETSIKNTELKQNRNRFSLLSLLYGMFESGDEQFIYKKDDPKLVFSADHGHFLPPGGKENWSINHLKNASDPRPNSKIRNGAKLTDKELKLAAKELKKIGKQDIARAVATPPDEWEITMEERIEIANFLLNRQIKLIDYVEKL